MKGQIPIHLTIEINLNFLNVHVYMFVMFVMLFSVHVLKNFRKFDSIDHQIFSECNNEDRISNKAARSTCSSPKTCSILQSLINSNDSIESAFDDDQLLSNSASNETTHNPNHLPCY